MSGPSRTGSAELRKRADGTTYFRGRIRLGDGARKSRGAAWRRVGKPMNGTPATTTRRRRALSDGKTGASRKRPSTIAVHGSGSGWSR
ncbi:MAG: hypothetical protein FWD73_14005 [Polyangiaceae bacterium]|nr:hypothetical protein [Polyangiaceae bacterium]